MTGAVVIFTGIRSSGNPAFIWTARQIWWWGAAGGMSVSTIHRCINLLSRRQGHFYNSLIEAALLFRRQQLQPGFQNDERIATPEIRDRPTGDAMKKYCWYHNSNEVHRSAIPVAVFLCQPHQGRAATLFLMPWKKKLPDGSQAFNRAWQQTLLTEIQPET